MVLFPAGFKKLVSYIDELLEMTSPQDYPVQKPQRKRPDRGITGLLHLLSKKIAVLVLLARLFARFKQISKSVDVELVKQIDFLVSVLRGITTFSQQHIVDFVQLLKAIADHVTANHASACEVQLFEFSGYLADRVIMSVPLQQLKTHWQMCMTCGKLMFGFKVEHTKCDQKECDAFLEKPHFACKF
jgi:hypothetical protein